jgi:uncharacterized surface protein with fasciclin (FAS1) repeats
MMNYKNKIFAIFALVIITIVGCKKWDKHTEVLQPDLNQNLLEAILAKPELSKFREYVGLVGLDSLLQSSKTYTIWAPTNTALLTIDPAIVGDLAKLKSFVLNHISNQQYFTRDVATPLNIQMLTGKYNTFSTTKFDDADVETTDKYVKNGVLHSIKSFVVPLQSIWEFINATTGTYAQNAFIKSLDFIGFDPAQAIVDSISEITGLPVYKPGTGLIPRNHFNDRVYDLKREDRDYTYFVVEDANFVLEADSLKPYFATTSTTATDSLTRWNIVKDLAYNVGYATAATIPQPLVSRSGITVPVNTAFVVTAQKMSNGYVYILSKLDVPTANKFLSIKIEGENPSGFLRNDKTSSIHYRFRNNPVTATNFNDIYIAGHAVTTFYAFYRTNETPSIKYKVYAKATNDFQTAAFTETINAWNTSLGALTGTLPFAVPLFTVAGGYDEKYLGEITNTRFGTIEWRATSITTGPILLDYLRLVPVP